MLNFLLDITPDKSQLLITIKLAGILREKKQEVYYTYTSNPAFTPVLYNKGISNCVLYPDDFRWLKPDLTLLDCRHAAHASLYRQLAIDYIFIAMQLPNQKNIQDKDISVLYLPPTPYLSSGSGPRVESLAKRLQDIKKDKGRNIIVGLLGKGNKNSKILEDFYTVMRQLVVALLIGSSHLPSNSTSLTGVSVVLACAGKIPINVVMIITILHILFFILFNFIILCFNCFV